MTDLDKFVELYKGFGIDCIVFIKDACQCIILTEAGWGHPEDWYTQSGLFEGYGDFYTEIKFTKEGKFKSQGFWE